MKTYLECWMEVAGRCSRRRWPVAELVESLPKPLGENPSAMWRRSPARWPAGSQFFWTARFWMRR